MELRWWWVLVIGVVALLAVAALLILRPLSRTHRSMRPLAHVDRLTRLPEYTRVYGTHVLSMLITAGLLVAVFAAALVATSRPIGYSSVAREFDAVFPEDIMLCVGQPVTDPSTSDFLRYFARSADGFTDQRIGLTSPSLRVVPLTRDYEYAKKRFDDFAKLSALQEKADNKQQLSQEDVRALDTGITGFSRSVQYVDYARSVEDILAMCLSGFPRTEDKGSHRRSLIYIGYSELGKGDPRASLYSTSQVQAMANKAGVQINAVARSGEEDPKATTALETLTWATHGQLHFYNPVGTAGTTEGDSPLTSRLDEIRNRPPDAITPAGKTITTRTWDAPNIALVIAIVAAAMLSVSLAVLRR